MRFANAISLVALFVALGGSAYAVNLDKNDVTSSNIKDGQVKSKDLKNDDVRSGDIEDGEVGPAEVATGAVGSGELATGSVHGDEVSDRSLAGGDLDFNSLTGLEIDEDSLDSEQLPATASFASQIRDIGTGGDVVYGGGSGRTSASADMAEVQMVAGPSTEIFGIQAWVETAPAPGESRSFRVVRRGDPTSAVLNTAITCTIGEGQRFCEDTTFVNSLNSNLFAIEVESVGAGLSSADDAYVGVIIGG